MQEAAELLIWLRSQGHHVRTENGQLRIQVPNGRMSSEDLTRIRARKQEIIQLLLQEDQIAYPPLRPRPAGAAVPLTPLQEFGWKYYEGGKTSLRVARTVLRIQGPLNVRVLTDCLDYLVHRHESLRTRIIAINGAPVQCVDAPKELSLDVTDLTRLVPPRIEAAAQRMVEEFVTEKVDLAVGPLFSAKLIKLSACEHVLVLALDHIISDTVSNWILTKEMWELYGQATRGLPLALSSLPVQFADYVYWQFQIHEPWWKEHEPYWIRRLSGARPAEIFPEKNTTGADIATSTDRDIHLGRELSVQLRAIARRNQTEVALVICTVYVALISRWCRQHDLTIRFLISGRSRPELENMIGFVADFLHLRIAINQADSFPDVLKKMMLEFRSAYDHQDFGYVPKLIPGWSWDLPQDHRLGFFWMPGSGMRAFPDRDIHNNLSICPYPYRETWSGVTFVPYFYDAPGGIGCMLIYNPSGFSSPTVERFARNLRYFAREFVEHPSVRVRDIPLLG